MLRHHTEVEELFPVPDAYTPVSVFRSIVFRLILVLYLCLYIRLFVCLCICSFVFSFRLLYCHVTGMIRSRPGVCMVYDVLFVLCVRFPPWGVRLLVARL